MVGTVEFSWVKADIYWSRQTTEYGLMVPRCGTCFVLDCSSLRSVVTSVQTERILRERFIDEPKSHTESEGSGNFMNDKAT